MKLTFKKIQSTAWFLLLTTNIIFANPDGGSVIAGSAVIQSNGSTLDITQTSDRAIINWNGFSIGVGELTRFLQPGADSAVLNRVMGGNPSSILGTLSANGQVYLINPNGILVGAGAVINTASFIASTLDVSNSHFMQGGDLNFIGSSTASVENRGTINASNGDVGLFAHSVQNSGSIQAANGTAFLAAGNHILLTADKGLLVQPTAASTPIPSSIGVNNRGIINAAAAVLAANGGNAYALAINNEGMIRATGGVRDSNGRVFLTSNAGNIQSSGSIVAQNANGDGGTIKMDGGDHSRVIVSGTLDVAGKGANSKGGQVNVLGDRVGLVSATINASGSGNANGGEILIGGDAHGEGNVRTALRTYVSADSTLKADAGINGNGGKVVIWANETTAYYGAISAKGGAESGNGGFAEVSGKENLDFDGEADLSAPHGAVGTLLLDPEDITITDNKPRKKESNDGQLDKDKPTRGQEAGEILMEDGKEGSSGRYKSFKISADKLQGLANTANVKLEARNNITIEPLKDNHDNQLIFAAATDSSHAGSITFTADADGSGEGDFSMDQADTIRADGRSVTISGVNVTVGTIDTSTTTVSLDGGAITLIATTGQISASRLDSSSNILIGDAGSGGTIALTAAGDIQVGDLSSFSLGDNSAHGGDISLTSVDGSIILNGNVDSYSQANGTAGNGGVITLLAAAGEIGLGEGVGIGNLRSYSEAANGNSGSGGPITLTSLGDAIVGNVDSHSFAVGGSSGRAGDVTITGPSYVSVQNITAYSRVADGEESPGGIEGQGGDVSLTGSEIDFISIESNGGHLTLAPYSFEQKIILGGTDNFTDALDLTLNELRGLAKGFSLITIGAKGEETKDPIDGQITGSFAFRDRVEYWPPFPPPPPPPPEPGPVEVPITFNPVIASFRNGADRFQTDTPLVFNVSSFFGAISSTEITRSSSTSQEAGNSEGDDQPQDGKKLGAMEFPSSFLKFGLASLKSGGS